MDIKEIQALADILKNADLSSIEITEGNLHIRLEKGQIAASAPGQGFVGVPSQEPSTAEITADPVSESALDTITSPMVGVFYATPSPDAPPYVTIGTAVERGDVLCVIEAMKLMNEVVAERDGVIADICVRNGDVVEFEQPLFRIQ